MKQAEFFLFFKPTYTAQNSSADIFPKWFVTLTNACTVINHSENILVLLYRIGLCIQHFVPLCNCITVHTHVLK